NNDLILVSNKQVRPPSKTAYGNDVLLTMTHQLHINVALIALVPGDKMCLGQIQMGFTPSHVIRKDKKLGIFGPLLNRLDGSLVISLVTDPTQQLIVQIISPSHMDADTVAGLNLLQHAFVSFAQRQLKLEILSKGITHRVKIPLVLPISPIKPVVIVLKKTGIKPE